MSPPETTSVASWPTTWPSCIAKSVPPMLRIMRLAPCDHRAHLFGRLLAHARAVRASAMRRRDRLGELRPDRHGRRDPGAAGEQLGGLRQRREVDRLVEPQRRDVEGLVEACPLIGGDLASAADAARSSPWRSGDAPVDAVAGCCSSPAAAGRRARPALAGSLGRPAAPARLDGIDAARAREELAQHLAELVFGVRARRARRADRPLRHLHISLLNRSAAARRRVWEMA